MRSIGTTCIVLAILFMALVTGCSRGSNPIAPSQPGRGAEMFFDCITAFDGTEDPYRDLDIATLIEKGAAHYQCLPAQIAHEGAPHGFSILVSLQDTGGPPGQGKVPMYRWLKDDGTAASLPTMFGIPGEDVVDYKFPKVDAIFVPEEGSITVAVSFMWRLLQEPPPNDTWNIGVVFLHWLEFQFLTDPIPPPFEDRLRLDAYPATQWGHDIAFNAYTGDAYLVYGLDTGAVERPYRLWYYFLWEEDDPEVYNWHMEGPWWAVDPGMVGNMWLPSIDVGLLNMHDENPEYPDYPIDFVGVAFTYKAAAPEPYRVAYNYWATYEIGNQTQNCDIVINPYVDPGLNYGLPCIDIAPNNSVPHYYAMTWVHENTEDHQYDVWLYDSGNNDMIRLLRPLESPTNARQKTLPSVACHYTGMNPPAASVSMYEDYDPGEPSGTYFPGAVFFDVATFQIGPWQSVQAGFNGVFGPWGAFDVAYLDSGIATDIVLTENNDYYLTFADSITRVPAPTMVYAAWGNTTT